MADTDDLTKIVKDLGAVSKSMLEASKSVARLTKDLAGVAKAVADLGKTEPQLCCGADDDTQCKGCPRGGTRSVTINLSGLSDAQATKGIAEQIADQIADQIAEQSKGCGGDCKCGKA